MTSDLTAEVAKVLAAQLVAEYGETERDWRELGSVRRIAAEVTNAVVTALGRPEVVEAVGDALTGQLVCYTLPANYNAPIGSQTHEDVVRRCGPLIASAVLAAIPEALREAAEEWPKMRGSHTRSDVAQWLRELADREAT